jgi:hypothetical protein
MHFMGIKAEIIAENCEFIKYLIKTLHYAILYYSILLIDKHTTGTPCLKIGSNISKLP